MKIFIMLFSVILSGMLYAQVNTFPYSQSFEAPFTTGHQTEFIPNWWGNYVVADTMGQYTDFANSGSNSLYLSPEGEEFKVIAQVKLDLTNAANMYTEFWVATRKNGLPEDQKRVKLNVGISLDGGKTFPFVKGIGPHEGFPNENTAFEKFMFVFPPATNGQNTVVLRFLTKSSGGPHRPAILLLDDITIIESPDDVFPPYIMGDELSITELTTLRIPFSEPLLPSVALNPASYTFMWPVEEHDVPAIGEGPLPKVSSVQLSPTGYSVILTLNPPMLTGETYLLEMYSITDLIGNVADLLSVDGIVYNIPAPGSLVFTEVLFADPSSVKPKTKLQYVEIFNPTTDIVPLGGLRIKGAIAAHNLPNVKLKPGEYWVATRNAEAYYATFGQTAWEWKGSWIESVGEEDGDEGEPVEPQSLYIQTTNRHGGKLVDSIGFDFTDPRWSALIKAGYSIELCNPLADNLDPVNWTLSNDNRDAYQYTVKGVNYDVFATPVSGCYTENTAISFCTYSQGFYGTENGYACSESGPQSTSLQLLQTVLPAGQQHIFGLTSTNRYFVLTSSDIYSKAIFAMLPGGSTPSTLRFTGASTFSMPRTWGAVPISTKKNNYGKLDNVLLSQAMTLYFNLRLNMARPSTEVSALANFKLLPVIVTAETSDCGLTITKPTKYWSVEFSREILDHLENQYADGATVGNLFKLAKQMLGADPALVRFDKKGKPIYTSVSAADIATALDAVNSIFKECRIYVPENRNNPATLAARQSATPVPVTYYYETTDDYYVEPVVTYPNPFVDKTTIEFTAPIDTWVTVTIYSATGNKVTTLFDGEVKRDELQSLVFAPSIKSSGVYIYKITMGDTIQLGRLFSVNK